MVIQVVEAPLGRAATVDEGASACRGSHGYIEPGPFRKGLNMLKSLLTTAVVAVSWGTVGLAHAQQPMAGSYQLQQPMVGSYYLQQPLIGSYQLQQPPAAGDSLQRPPAAGYYLQQPPPVYYYLLQPGYGGSPWDDTALEAEAPEQEP
jgi:hypothetical protein